jgi:ABC-type transport system involved in cytochrome bd biosynthesis fused ATPase/permease subunit
VSDAAIDLADVRFSWPLGRCVLAIRRLTIQPGERVFLHGRSGSGKWEWAALPAIIASALVMSLLPAFRAYRNTLSDGLQMRV